MAKYTIGINMDEKEKQYIIETFKVARLNVSGIVLDYLRDRAKQIHKDMEARR